MRPLLPAVALCLASSCAYGQIHFHKVSVPAGKTLDKALAKSQLTRPGAKPFHLKLEINQTKGADGDVHAVIEEFWASPEHWSRTVTAPGLSQTVLRDSSGTHFASTGDYFPSWLRDFVTGMFDPVPDADVWDQSHALIEYLVLPNGTETDHCEHREFMLGAPSDQQINFANICFDHDGLIKMAQSPAYTMGFSDYAPFNKLRVPRTLLGEHHGVQLTGKVTTLEEFPGDPSQAVTLGPDAQSSDRFAPLRLTTESLLTLASGVPKFQWPNPIPGHGQFTVWVCLDKTGRVREAHSLNSDLSGLAADMSAQLVGRQWKVPVADGGPVQVQGALVISYPPPPAQP